MEAAMAKKAEDPEGFAKDENEKQKSVKKQK